MDKNAIKRYAVWARNELIARVTQKAEQYEITEKKITSADADSIGGRLLTDAEKKQRAALIEKIKADGFEQMMEEAAYTWFNRFTALRFMEVNNYLPSHTRVFTNESGEFKPQILADAIQLELEGLNMDKVYELKDANKAEELYKYLLITQCNALSGILPRMFQKIEDYTELLLPDYLLREGSVIEQMITLIPEDDWTDQVQIIGWLYQAYITEQNELVYDGTLSKERIPKNLLPAATTIYTPDWPVRYMVENSLGRLWIEGHPSEALTKEWKYFLEEAKQELEIEQKFEEIREEYKELRPEDIRCIDPCMGSGHILCVYFDTLIRIYEDYGYTSREAAASIVKNNIWGLDIDQRAAQLAYFAVMMKARSYDRRFLTRNIQPHIFGIVESNSVNIETINYFSNGDTELKKNIETIIKEMKDAREYGSILKVSYVDLIKIYSRINELTEHMELMTYAVFNDLLPVIQVYEALTQTYHIVCTNPPYLGSGRFSPKLDQYTKSTYPDEKSDLSMIMYRHAVDDLCKENGFVSFITTSSWMSLSSFEKLRNFQQNSVGITSIVDFGTELFDGKVGHNPIVAWVARKSKTAGNLIAVRLVDYCYSRRDEKEEQFLNGNNRYIANQENFSKIPGIPIAYWISDKMISVFDGETIYDYSYVQEGLKTGANERFIRNWFEVDINRTNVFGNNKAKWAYHTKGGDYRKWYGNRCEVLNYDNDGKELKSFKGASLSGAKYYFLPNINYNRISSSKTSFRYSDDNSIPNMAGLAIYPKEGVSMYYLLGWLNTSLICSVLEVTNPTLNFPPGTIGRLPIRIDNFKKSKIENVVEKNIDLSRSDWDSFETSWDFQFHPLVPSKCECQKQLGAGMNSDKKKKSVTLLAECYGRWECDCEYRFSELQKNEEELNRIFIDIYGLQNEMKPDVADKDVTVRKADLQRDLRSLISYAVGCMFGRYSLDLDGLAYAGGEWDADKYISFPADKDNIIPICDDEYFEDDIVGLFVEFVKTVYGADTLDENLKFIADALGGKGQPKDVIRNYFLSDFYSDHCKIYQKRPIYWLFDSGKKNGFKALIYMHRYKADTIARIRTDYVHEQQSRYRTAIEDLEKRMKDASTSERVKLNKQLTKFQAQAEETRIYEEKIHYLADQMISIDLDDGVKVNYAKFQDVLAKIK